MEDEVARAPSPKRRAQGDSPTAPCSLKNVIVQTASTIREVITGTVTGSTSSASNHLTDRAREEQDRTAKEWSAGAASPKASTEEPPSAQSGTSSVPMEVEIEGYTQEQMAHARDAALDMRPSLKLAYNQVLDIIGSTGLIFKKPQPANTSEYPSVSAVPSEAPSEEILKYVLQNGSDYSHKFLWPAL